MIFVFNTQKIENESNLIHIKKCAVEINCFENIKV